MENVIVVETLFPKGVVLDMQDASYKLNKFAADTGKSLTCKVFVKAESRIPHTLFLNDFYTIL